MQYNTSSYMLFQRKFPLSVGFEDSNLMGVNKSYLSVSVLLNKTLYQDEPKLITHEYQEVELEQCRQDHFIEEFAKYDIEFY